MSPSEVYTLELLGDPEHYPDQLDWIAVQRLKRMGLVENNRNLVGGVRLTPAGQTYLRKHLST